MLISGWEVGGGRWEVGGGMLVPQTRVQREYEEIRS